MGLFFKNKSKETPDKNVAIERSRIETDFRSFVLHIATEHSGESRPISGAFITRETLLKEFAKSGT